MKLIPLTIVSIYLSSIGLTSATPLTLNDNWSPVTWSDIPVHEKQLFYPGKLTFNWVNSSRHKGYANKFFNDRTCGDCHKGEEFGMGNMLVKSSQDWLNGKEGSISVKIQVAHDDQELFIRAQWKSQVKKPARLNKLMQMNNGEWHAFGGPKSISPNNSVAEDGLSFMIDDGSVPLFAEQACFLSCHTGSDGLDPITSEEVSTLSLSQAHPVKPNQLTKYLPATRNSHAKWNKPVSQSEMDKLKQEGQFVDLWHWRSASSAPLGFADDQYILDARYQDEGKPSSRLNFDALTGQPKYMFDSVKTGHYALSTLDIKKQNSITTLMEGINTQQFDLDKIKPNQLLPQEYFVAPEGSGADLNRIESSAEDGVYTVVLRRKLDTGNPLDDKIFSADKIYTIGMAIHDNDTANRSHFISFPFTLTLSKKANAEITSSYIGTRMN